jgi:hypothetical protein
MKKKEPERLEDIYFNMHYTQNFTLEEMKPECSTEPNSS